MVLADGKQIRQKYASSTKCIFSRKVIENILVDKDIVARFVLYNDSDKTEIINGKKVIYKGNYEKLAALDTSLFRKI